MKSGKASAEQLKARLERRRSNAAGPHLNKGLRDRQDWRSDVDDELEERFYMDPNVTLLPSPEYKQEA